MRSECKVMIQELSKSHKEYGDELGASHVATFHGEELLRDCVWWGKNGCCSWKTSWCVVLTVFCIFGIL